MKTLFDPSGPVHRVLSVSSSADDHLALRRLLGGAGWALWEARSCAEAARLLEGMQVAAVICDEILTDGGWVDVLTLSARIETPPPVIVTSRLADERLWAAVLDLGGYNLLSKPCDPVELVRVLGLACDERPQYGFPLAETTDAVFAAGSGA